MKKAFPSFLKLLVVALAFVALVYGAYLYGFRIGYNEAIQNAQVQVDEMIALVENGQVSLKKTPTPSAPSIPQQTTRPPAPKPAPWGGPELWEAVNKRRIELGVNGLSQKDEICTIASIRLNELLELGKLDGHEGFSTLPERRKDLAYIYEKYTLTEFLISGATSPADAVSSWQNTLAHKKLLTGGEYVWGCIYAQNTFAVAITAY